MKKHKKNIKERSNTVHNGRDREGGSCMGGRVLRVPDAVCAVGSTRIVVHSTHAVVHSTHAVVHSTHAIAHSTHAIAHSTHATAHSTHATAHSTHAIAHYAITALRSMGSNLLIIFPTKLEKTIPFLTHMGPYMGAIYIYTVSLGGSVIVVTW